jgi:hypothetical protein
MSNYANDMLRVISRAEDAKILKIQIQNVMVSLELGFK